MKGFSTKIAVVSFYAAAVLFSSIGRTDEPPTMGKCSGSQKEGDVCALGTCYKGKQTVYKCAEERQCKKSDSKQDCDENKKVNPPKES